MDSYVIGATTTVIILVTVLIFVGGVLKMRHEERRIALEAKAGAANDPQWDAKWQDAQAEIARLKDRVAVLERLATDEDRRIASEISRLQPSAEARG